MTTERFRLAIVIGSIGAGRFGATAAQWFAFHASRRGDLDVDVLDLACAWSPDLWSEDDGHVPAAVNDLTPWLAGADAFVMITPECNCSFPAALKAAIDWHHHAWSAKPVGFVCYGGPAGGLRAVEHLRQVLTAMDAVTVRESVSLHDPCEQVDASGKSTDPACDEAAEQVLDQLTWWARALRRARAERPLNA